MDLGDNIDFQSDTLVLQPFPILYPWECIPPNLPLPPPLLDLLLAATPPSLDPISNSAHPQLTSCGVGSPLVCRSPARLALSLEDPSTPPSASEAQTPPQSCDPVAPPWLPAPSFPPEPVSPPAPPGSLVPPAPPWSVVPLPPPRDYTPPATPRPFIPLAPVGLFLPSSSTSVLCCSAAAFRSTAYTSVTKASGSALAFRIFGLTLALRLSVASSGSTTTCSAAVGRSHGVSGHSSTMAPPSLHGPPS